MLAIERLRLTLPRFVESEPSGHVVSHVLIANPKAPYPTKAPFPYPRSLDRFAMRRSLKRGEQRTPEEHTSPQPAQLRW